MHHRDRDLLKIAVRTALLVGMAGAVPAWSDPLPAGLMPVLYDKLASDPSGRSQPISRNGCSDLASQKLHACFTAAGAAFQSPGNSQLHLSLTGIGRAAAIATLAPVKPDFGKAQVEYRHPDVTEWWRSLPVGYEQGFTIPRRPEGRGKLTLELAATSQPHKHGDDLEWQRIQYGDLEVYDSRRQRLPAKFDVTGDHIAIRVDDRNATYPLTVDPLVWVEQKDVAADGAANDGFGYAVAAFGNTVAVGAPFVKVGGNTSAGAVYLFSQSNGLWTQKTKLTAATPVAHAEFGAALAINGTTLVVGAPMPAPFGCTDLPPNTNILATGPSSNASRAACSAGSGAAAGNVYVFNKSGGGLWTQSQVLMAADTLGTPGNQFGAAVAISGTTLVVGAPMAQAALPPGGVLYTYVPCNSAATTPIVKAFRAPTSAIPAAGSPGGPAVQLGAAYEFTETGNQWQQTQKITDDRVSQHGEFGYSVAISGTNIAVGAPFAAAFCNNPPAGYSGAPDVGLVDVYSYSAGSLRGGDRLLGPTRIRSAEFGLSVALSGTHLAVGAPNASIPHTSPGSSTSALANPAGNEVSQGAAFLYNMATAGSTVTWTPVAEFNADDGFASDRYGWSLALSGTTLYVGSPRSKAHDNLNDSQGGLYVYAPDSTGKYHEEVKLIAKDGKDGDAFAQALAVTGVTAVAGAPNAKIGANTKQGAVYFDADGSLAVAVHMPASISTAGSFFTTVTVTNNTSTATAPLTVTLPAPTATGVTATVVSATTTQGTCTIVSSTYTCTLNAIPANGGTASITVTVMVSGGTIGTTLTETATITNTTPTVSGMGTTRFESLSSYKGASNGSTFGAFDLWTLGFLTSLLALRALSLRRRDPSG